MTEDIAKKTLNIGIDFDGVVADTIKLKHKLAKQLYGVEGIESSRFKEYMVVEDGFMTREQYRKLMNTVCGDLKFGMEMEGVEHAAEYISSLKNAGHKVMCITSREGSEVKVVQQWFKLKELDFDIVSVGYSKDKREAAHGLDVYIDDDLPKLTPLIGIIPHLFLFSQDHNLSHDVPEGIIRVSSWSEFYEKLQTSIYAK